MHWIVPRAHETAVPILAVATLLAGCGRTSVIEASGAQRAVAQLVSSRTGFRPTDVRCPSGVPAKAGGTFECHFTGPDGPYTAFMRIADVHGTRVDFDITTRRTA